MSATHHTQGDTFTKPAQTFFLINDLQLIYKAFVTTHPVGENLELANTKMQLANILSNCT